jgi:hypothetical protein
VWLLSPEGLVGPGSAGARSAGLVRDNRGGR